MVGALGYITYVAILAYQRLAQHYIIAANASVAGKARTAAAAANADKHIVIELNDLPASAAARTTFTITGIGSAAAADAATTTAAAAAAAADAYPAPESDGRATAQLDCLPKLCTSVSVQLAAPSWPYMASGFQLNCKWI